MKQILSPFQKYECFAVDGVDYLVVDYTIVQDKDDNLVEWASEMKFKRLKDHNSSSSKISVEVKFELLYKTKEQDTLTTISKTMQSEHYV